MSTTQTKKKKYTRRSTEQWRSIVNQYAKSDMSHEAFCSAHGVAPSGLYNWRKRFSEEHSTQDPSTEQLIEITPQLTGASSKKPNRFDLDTENDSWQVELQLGSGCILRFRAS